MIPLVVLSVGALFAGLAFKEFFIGANYGEFWKKSLFLAPGNNILDAAHHVPGWVAMAPFVMMSLGFLVSAYVYVLRPGTADRWAKANPLLYKFLLNKWYVDELYDFLFVRPAFWLGRLFWKGGDGRIIDGMGPDGIAARVVDVTNRVVRVQSGYVYHYAFAMLIGVAAFITWYLVGGVR